MQGSRKVQNVLVAIFIFVLIALFIMFFFDHFLLEAILILMAFGALLRVLYQIVRPPEPESIKLKGKSKVKVGPLPRKDKDTKRTVPEGEVEVHIKEKSTVRANEELIDTEE
jgi:hypothetical protein